MITKKGISASPGVAIGPALVLDTEEYRIPRRLVEPAQVPRQIRLLDGALEASREEVAQLRLAAARKLGDNVAGIFAFHEALIGDETLRRTVVELIERESFTAAYAFGQEMSRRQREFRAINNAYLKERVRDLIDIEKRVLRHILGKAREDITRLTEPVVIVAHDITPSQAVSFDREHILGFAINVGGSTSHMAIIARMLGIPAVVGLNDVTSDVSGGETLVIDGRNGIVIATPDDETVERFRAAQRQHIAFERRLSGLRDLPAVTQDGVEIALLANIEFAEEVRAAIENGAQGIGLYRSEFLYLAKEKPPTEEEQYEVYRAAVRHARGKPVTIRTIDLGADKMSDYLGGAHEQNPVLGLRSLRYCLQHLDMFKTHLRAILRAAAEGQVRIMFPMITTLMELLQARHTLADVMEDLDEDGIAYRRDVQVGMMVETPAAAIMAGAFAGETSFLSIGTNDLTQYTLAVDRGNERVAHLYAPHHPAVLRLIRDVVIAGRKSMISVNVCGEMAGESIYTELLIGLGLRQLSMAPKEIADVKRIIRATTIPRCEQIARKVMRFDADRQVYNYLRDQFVEFNEAEQAGNADVGAESAA